MTHNTHSDISQFCLQDLKDFSSSRSSARNVKGYDSHSSLYRVGEEQTSRGVDLFVLLLDVA